ncbi:MAG: PAS domain S-box protein [Anaerolineales bacterium]
MVRGLLTIILPLVILAGIAIAANHFVDAGHEMDHSKEMEFDDVQLLARLISSDLGLVVSDLMILSESYHLQAITAGGDAMHYEGVAQEFLSFATRRGIYDQIRLLDETGMETVRIDVSGGRPELVPHDRLEFSGDGYDFQETFRLEPGQVFISPLDLKSDDGVLEQPIKPLIRLGMPIFDASGQEKGVVILNYLGADLIGNLESEVPEAHGQMSLLNAEGFWLKGPKPEDEWGFKFPDRGDRTFGNAFPEAWQQILGVDSGQFQNSEGRFAFATVHPLIEAWEVGAGSDKAMDPSAGPLEASDYYWKIVLHILPATLNAETREELGKFILLGAVLVLPAAAASWKMAQAEKNREMAQETLQASEARFRGLFEGSPDAILIADEEGRIRYINAQSERLFGYDQHEMLGKPVELVVPDRMREPHLEYRKSYADDPHSRPMGARQDLAGLRKDGSEIPVEIGLTPLVSAEGHLTVAVIRDITERKAAERHLAIEHAMTRVLAESRGVSETISKVLQTICEHLEWEIGELWGIDRQANHLHCIESWRSPSIQLPRFDEITKKTTLPAGVGLPGRVWASKQPLWIPDLAQDPALPRAEVAAEVGLHAAFAFPILLGSEALGVMTFISHEIHEPDNELLEMLVSIGSQVGQFMERKQAGQALHRSEQRLRQVTGAIDQYIYSFDIEADGALRCLLATPSVSRFTGRSVEEHRADPDLWPQHIHPEDRQRVQDAVQALIDDSAAMGDTNTYRVEDTDGNVLWARDEVHLTRDERGQAVRIEGIVTDISALKQAQQSLEERNRSLGMANERLEELDQIKSSFLANMSHELRTPLNSIIGFSRLLADGLAGELAGQQHEFVEDIHGSGQDLLTLINDLLDLSKIEAGQLELHPESISFEELAQETIDTVLPLVQQKGQELIGDIPSDLPPLNADRFRIKQVLLNLLSNAHKFTPEGGSITARAYVLDETALLCSVMDTGIGIPAESLDMIFEEFRQAGNSPARDIHGTGLGLPISRQLIEMHGGTIWVESTKGEGSTFSFLLPLSGPQDALPSVYAEPGLGETWPLDSERLVMIVEDDRRFANMLGFYFTREGFDVAQIFSGDHVVERARQLGPCLISLDLMLPQTDGWQVLRQLKADPQTADIPVVIVSVLDPTESSGIWQSLGALDYIVKPLSREQLERLLALARASLPRPIQVLVVDDDAETGRLLQLTFPQPAFNTELMTDAQDALERLVSDLPDVLVLDLMMPGLSGIKLLERLHQNPATQDLPVVILSAKKLTSEEEAHLGSMAQAIIHKEGRMQLSQLLDQVKQTLGLERELAHA